MTFRVDVCLRLGTPSILQIQAEEVKNCPRILQLECAKMVICFISCVYESAERLHASW